MQAITANEAKTQFGELLIKAQREPVQINKNGKPVAVVLSIEEYQIIEGMKHDLLKQRLAKAKLEIASNQLKAGESVFDSILG